VAAASPLLRMIALNDRVLANAGIYQRSLVIESLTRLETGILGTPEWITRIQTMMKMININ
jgi:hypothetical protein